MCVSAVVATLSLSTLASCHMQLVDLGSLVVLNCPEKGKEKQTQQRPKH